MSLLSFYDCGLTAPCLLIVEEMASLDEDQWLDTIADSVSIICALVCQFSTFLPFFVCRNQ